MTENSGNAQVLTQACSAYSSEPLAGTASHQQRWLCVENRGSWGREVYDGTALGDKAADIQQRLEEHHIRLLFIRRNQGVRASQQPLAMFYIDVSHGGKMVQHTLDKLDDLGELTVQPHQWLTQWQPCDNSLFLVCTHGKRDQCCAVKGRPVAAGLSAEFPHQVWESSHTGGHRFAPALVVFPTGYSYGGSDEDMETLQRHFSDIANSANDNTILLTALRGHVGFDEHQQCADIAVRQWVEDTGETVAPGALEITTQHRTTDSVALSVASNDGRAWTVQLVANPVAQRPPSCGKPPVASVSWQVSNIAQLM